MSNNALEQVLMVTIIYPRHYDSSKQPPHACIENGEKVIVHCALNIS